MEKDVLDKEYIEYYEKRIAEELEDIAISADDGKVEFARVYHSRRAQRFGRISDGNTTEYANIALEYFGNRCALSGEKFETFELEDSSYKTNLSAEHIVALAIGGHDIAPNIVPSVLQYNLRKNGYYILDYWSKQKDNNGKPIYSPYRLLKVVNYMLKSIEARKSPNAGDIESYRQAILTPNAIDELLSQIEEQDLQETDNSKRKILSSTITTTTLDEDNKKILTTVPSIDRDIPDQNEQAERENDYREMMESFISDSIGVIGRELPQLQITRENGTQVALSQELQSRFERVVDTIPLEVQIRQTIIDSLEQQGIENVYTITNSYIYNTDILERVRKLPEEERKEYVTQEITTRIQELSALLTKEEMITLVSSEPYVIYDEGIVDRITLWQKLDIQAPDVHPRNIEFTLRIMQEYNFEQTLGRKLKHDEEKLLVQSLLGLKVLNKSAGCVYISTLQNKLQDVGLTEQEAYGAIINYAIGTGNGNYNAALGGMLKYDSKNREEIVTQISRDTLKELLWKNGMEFPENIEKIKRLGIDVGEARPQNIDLALRIVQEYNFEESIGRKLTQDEEKAIVQSLLGPQILKKTYIFLLKDKLQSLGLTEQETYGAIINYAIGTGNGSYSDALHGRMKYNTNMQEDIVIIVDESVVKEALLKNGLEVPENTRKLRELGIEAGETAPRNIDLALKIVQEYNFEEVLGRKLSQDEERALVQALISNSILKKGTGNYISKLQSKLIEAGLTEQEAYGAIINYAIGTGVGNYDSALTGKIKYSSDTKAEIVTTINDNIIKKVTLINNLTDEKILENTEKLKCLVIKTGEIDPKNIDFALTIVGQYNFKEIIGRDLTQDEEKAIVQSLISNSILKKGTGNYISKLQSKLIEAGLTEQETYGAIINYAIGTGNGSYSDALGGALKYDSKNIEAVVTKVSRDTLKELLWKNGMEVPENANRLKELGIEIGETSPRNIDLALKIVQEYKFEDVLGRRLSQDEERALVQALLSQKILNKAKGKRTAYIDVLKSKLEEVGLTEQEAYGAIINYAIGTGNGSYSAALGGALKYDSKNVEAVVTKVSRDTLKELLWKNGMEVQKNTNSLKGLGIVAGKTSPRNVDLALKIVQEYNFEGVLGRKLSEDEEKVLVQALIGNKMLDEGKTIYINTLKSKLQDVGLTEQESYGAIINYAIGTGNGSYSDALAGVLKYSSKTKEEIVTAVTEAMTIQIEKMALKEAVKTDEISDERIAENEERLQDLEVNANQVHPKNIDFALRIIQEYNFEETIGRKLTHDEQKLLVQSLLGLKVLNKSAGCAYISTLQSKLQGMGLTEQEAYGAIINYAIGTGNDNYNHALGGTIKYDSKTREDIVTQISRDTLKELLWKNGMEVTENTEKIKRLGIDAGEARPQNIDYTLKIVQEYNFEEALGRKLTQDEEKAIIQSLLGPKTLKKHYISVLKNKLQEVGLTEQEAYGTIINYAIGTGIGNFSNALHGKIKYSSENIAEIKKDITEVDVSKAIIKLQGKALKSVKKAVSKETITQIDDTLAAIDSIVVERDGRQKQTV